MPVQLKDVKGIPNGSLRKVKIGLNRERLYDIVWHFVDEPSECKNIVDDILSNEAQIIEVKP